MKNWKFLLIGLFIFLVIGLPSCITTVEVVKYIEIPPPKHQPFPHPVMPILETNGEITQEKLMEQIILLAGAIEKLQVLVEIYEREICELPKGYSNAKFSGKSLEELKVEYYKLLGIYEEYIKALEAEKNKTTTTPQGTNQ